MALKRINRELNDYLKNKDDYPDICLYTTGDDYFILEASINGPINTPYEGGTYIFDILLPRDYPFKPPKISLKTPIYHPNVFYPNIFSVGNICCCHIPAFTDQWSPALTILKLLIMIKNLIQNPDISVVCGEQAIYEEYKNNYDLYVSKAINWTKKYAMPNDF